jgi:hypothetical protein
MKSVGLVLLVIVTASVMLAYGAFALGYIVAFTGSTDSLEDPGDGGQTVFQ